MKNLLIITLACFVFGFTVSIGAEELSAEGSKILKQIGIPVYPGSKFINGTTGDITSFRFASSDGEKKVRDWYREKFPKWALENNYGSWILYNGKPGGGPAEYMYKNQILVQENIMLIEWFSLPASMTTEIIISLPLSE